VKELDADQRLVLGRARLRALRSRPYFASVLLALRPWSLPGLGTVGVDATANLYIDFDSFGSWTEDVRAGVLVHEIGHLLRGHHERASRLGADVDRVRWNIAADIEINDDINLPLPGEVVVAKDFGVRPNQLAETNYYDLEGHDFEGWEHIECGGCVDGLPRPWERSSRGGLTAAELDAIRRKVAQDACALGAGMVASGDRRWAEATLRSTVDWRSLLRAGIGSSGRGSGSSHWTFRRPSRRRRLGPGVILPSTFSPQQHIALVVDTSASMSDHDLALVAAEADAICRSVPGSKVRLVSCDVVATDEGDLRSGRPLRLTGGGGTDMVVGIELALQGRPSASVIVVATDGYTSWPDDLPVGRTFIALLVGKDAPAPPEWVHSIVVT